ncbi:PHP domain-containing protein [Tessaracoccus rhinocerotis]|uniref:PHP domain-containing protein n=1 Tax=Tessaracoccus rhinocerotis TaxID=1689449 RepID=A0A553K3W7_9ACTN|nr:PHP domain-containing protein [Tessaracoccus rhinocerotis]TRY19385.1 PHP domain-containing protein [Tessaracoccus rhinocerotis]
MRIDLHTHSRVSDGTDAPAQLVAEAVAAGLDVVALTDHDTFDGLPEAFVAGEALGIRVVGGIEISTELEGRSVHLLGYGCDEREPALAEELVRNREGRDGRLPLMCARLAEAGVGVTMEEVLAAAAGAPSLGRPHFADAMIAKGHVVNRAEAFDLYLAEGRPGYVARYSTPLRLAIDLVHGAGGAAVLAHPWGRGGAAVLTPDVVADLAGTHGLDGIEVDHADHDEAQRRELAALARELGLVATGSSDYHGTGKQDHPLGVNTTTEAAFEELLRAMNDHRTAGR